MSRIPPSSPGSRRPSTSPTRAVSGRPAGPGPPTSGRSGPLTCWRCRKGPRSPSSTRPIEPASWDAADRCGPPYRSSTGGHSRTPWERSSIPSSASAAGSGSPPARRHPPCSRPPPPSRVRRSSSLPTRSPGVGLRARGDPVLDAGPGPAASLGIDADEAHLFQRLANRIVYSDPTLRPPVSQLARNRRGVSGLWPHGISGDLPIVVARIDGPDGLDVVRQLLRAHEYWRMKLVDADLVIVNEGAISYAQDFQGALEAPLSVTGARPGQPVRAGSRIARGARCGPYPARRSPVRERSAAAAWRPADRAPDSCGKASRTRSAAQDRPGEGIAARALAAGTVRPCTSADPTVARPSRARVVHRPGGLRR